jgi:RNA polymerase sigma factor (sigma-70 family)
VDAEDVLHQAYCKVLDGRARFDGRSSFKTWLFGVIQRTASEERRWGWLRLGRLERWWRERADGDGTDPSLPVEDERVTNLQAALTKLSRRQQQVLHLVFFQEMTVQDAADVLAMPVGTARTHYERGKARLRQLLASEDRR